MCMPSVSNVFYHKFSPSYYKINWYTSDFPHFCKGDNLFYDFLCSLKDEALPKVGSALKGKSFFLEQLLNKIICFKRSKFFPLGVYLCLVKRQKYKKQSCFPLSFRGIIITKLTQYVYGLTRFGVSLKMSQLVHLTQKLLP